MGIEEARELAAALGNVPATYLLCQDDEGILTGDQLRLVTLFRATDERSGMRLFDVAQSMALAGEGEE